MQFIIISRLGRICLGLEYYSIRIYVSARLGSSRRGRKRAMVVSANAWHAILYLITPWQYSPRLGMAVSAEALKAILYLITPWQYQQGLLQRTWKGRGVERTLWAW